MKTEHAEDKAVFTEQERCLRCKGTGFIGKAVDVEGNPIGAADNAQGKWSYEEVAQLLGMSEERSSNYNLVVLRDAINASIRNITNERDQLAIAVDEWKEKYFTEKKALSTTCKALVAADQQLATEKERCDEIWRIGKAELAAERDCSRRFEAQVDDCQQQLTAERELRDEARAQREHLIKECARIGVTVNVAIGAPVTEAYVLVNTALNAAIAEALASETTSLLQSKAVNDAISAAQQPLVDALKKCKSQLDMEPQRLPLVERLQGYIKDALAKVKEGK